MWNGCILEQPNLCHPQCVSTSYRSAWNSLPIVLQQGNKQPESCIVLLKCELACWSKDPWGPLPFLMIAQELRKNLYQNQTSPITAIIHQNTPACFATLIKFANRSLQSLSDSIEARKILGRNRVTTENSNIAIHICDTLSHRTICQKHEFFNQTVGVFVLVLFHIQRLGGLGIDVEMNLRRCQIQSTLLVSVLFEDLGNGQQNTKRVCNLSSTVGIIQDALSFTVAIELWIEKEGNTSLLYDYE